MLQATAEHGIGNIWTAVKPVVDYALLPLLYYILRELRLLAQTTVTLKVRMAVVETKLGVPMHSPQGQE